MTHFLSTNPFRRSTGSFRGDNKKSRARVRRRLAAAAMRGCQVNALNSATRQRAKVPGVSFAFFATRVRDRRQIRVTTAQEMLKEQRGATAIEMAMCLPILILLIVGLMQLGTVMLMQALFHTSMKDVRLAVLAKSDETATKKAFCDSLGGKVQMLRCKSTTSQYEIDVREKVASDSFSRTIPADANFVPITSKTDDGSVRFIRVYLELPVFWSAFTPVFASGDKIPLYAASAIVYPALSNTVLTTTSTP